MVTDTIDDKYLVGYKSRDFRQKNFLGNMHLVQCRNLNLWSLNFIKSLNESQSR